MKLIKFFYYKPSLSVVVQRCIFLKISRVLLFLYIALHLIVIEVTIQISLISPKGVSTERWVESITFSSKYISVAISKK